MSGRRRKRRSGTCNLSLHDPYISRLLQHQAFFTILSKSCPALSRLLSKSCLVAALQMAPAISSKRQQYCTRSVQNLKCTRRLQLIAILANTEISILCSCSSHSSKAISVSYMAERRECHVSTKAALLLHHEHGYCKQCACGKGLRKGSLQTPKRFSTTAPLHPLA